MMAALITMRRRADELERSAALAAGSGMFRSGAALRNKAAGIRMAIEILKEVNAAAPSTEVEQLVKGGAR